MGRKIQDIIHHVFITQVPNKVGEITISDVLDAWWEDTDHLPV